jgi:acetyl-CoA carboxylase carboxyl transferase subunit alpha
MASEHAPAPTVLDFEKPIVELELRLAKLRALSETDPDLVEQADALADRVERLQRETFASLSRWQVVQLARHPRRPSPLDFVERLAPDLVELHGDKSFADDPAILGGPATVAGRAAMVLAHARGRSPDEQQARNYGMARPEGFRKAERLVKLADRLGLPIVTFIDTPGAFPGAEAEERGQAPAIAACLEALAGARSPVVACVVGEGGSGGALALSVSDRLLILEYAIFAVISPEACSSILYRDGAHAAESAEALRLTAKDLASLRLVDEVVAEPPGGAHRDVALAAGLLGARIAAHLDALAKEPEHGRLEARYRRLRSYGEVAWTGAVEDEAE